MKKIVKEHYKEILIDLQPLFKKWGVEGLVRTLWTYQRKKRRLEELEIEKQKIEQELTKLKG